MEEQVKRVKTRVRNKHKTEAEWYLDVYDEKGEKRDNPFIPLDGELIIFDKDEKNDYDRFKFGDGTTNVIDLPFVPSTTIVSELDLNDGCQFGLDLCKAGLIGEQVYLTGSSYTQSDLIININKKQLAVEAEKWVYNTPVDTSNIFDYQVVIYDKNYRSPIVTNSYGAAMVFNSNGKLIKIYDGANIGYYTEEGKAQTVHFNSSTYGTVAFSELSPGEVLIIFPNDGYLNPARNFALGCRFDGSIGKITELTGFSFEQGSKTIKIEDKTYKVFSGMWAYNEEINSKDYTYSVIILDKKYTGSIYTNSYGVAVIIDANGKLIKIYDAANGKGFYYSLTNVDSGRQDGSTIGLNNNNYCSLAWDELGESETLIIFPYRPNLDNSSRAFALSLRGIDGNGRYILEEGQHLYFNKPLKITDFLFPKGGRELSIGGLNFFVDYNKFASNMIMSYDKAITYSLLKFHKGQDRIVTGDRGIAMVLDTTGKLVKIYDGINILFYDNNGKEKGHFTKSNFSQKAYEELQDGESLLVFPNNEDYKLIIFSNGKEIKINNNNKNIPEINESNEGQVLMVTNGKPTWTPISTSIVSYDNQTHTLSITTS